MSGSIRMHLESGGNVPSRPKMFYGSVHRRIPCDNQSQIWVIGFLIPISRYWNLYSGYVLIVLQDTLPNHDTSTSGWRFQSLSTRLTSSKGPLSQFWNRLGCHGRS